MKTLTKLAALAIASIPLALTAAPLSDSDLVQSAVVSEARISDPAVIQRLLDSSRARLTEKIAANPNQVIGGVIVFARGLESKQVAQFVDSHKLDVTGAEAKVSVGDRGIADTMGFGAQSLFFLDGTLDERLDKLVGRQRSLFMAESQIPDNPNATNRREAAYSQNIRFYKIEAVGPALSFDAIQKGTEAAAVFVDQTDERVRNLAVARENAARMRPPGSIVITRPYADGPPPGVHVDPRVPSMFGGPVGVPPDPPSQQPTQPAR